MCSLLVGFEDLTSGPRCMHHVPLSCAIIGSLIAKAQSKMTLSGQLSEQYFFDNPSILLCLDKNTPSFLDTWTAVRLTVARELVEQEGFVSKHIRDC